MPHNQYPYSEQDYVTVAVREELSDGSIVYVATHPEIEGCMAHGDTEEEARENLKEAFVLSMDHILEYGLPIPVPQSRRRLFYQRVLSIPGTEDLMTRPPSQSAVPTTVVSEDKTESDDKYSFQPSLP